MSNEIALFYMFVQDLQRIRMLTLSPMVVFTYDIITTFPDELDFIWRSPWSGGKILYFITRYPPALYGVACLLYDMGFTGSMFHFCRVMGYFEIWSTWLFGIPVQVILILRTWAIWQRSWKVAGVLIFGAVVYNITLIVCSAKFTKATHYQPQFLVDTLQECYTAAVEVSPIQNIIKVAFSALMFFDGIAFTLIMIKAIQSGRSGKANILNVLIRDGAVYYGVLFVLSVANLLLATVLSPQRAIYVTSLAHATVVAQAIGGSHIILNLRKYASRTEQDELPSLRSSGTRLSDGRRPIKIMIAREVDSDFSPEYSFGE